MPGQFQLLLLIIFIALFGLLIAGVILLATHFANKKKRSENSTIQEGMSENAEELPILIDFNNEKEITMPGMNNGTGSMSVKMFSCEKGKIIPTKIHAGGSIGMHRQDSGDDINYILSGEGRAVCDGKEAPLRPGVCHICPQGSSHCIINTGEEDLVMLTLVVHR
jgi:mannose-6-phosphate isomerase-like protein (cupin superfamily)